MAGCDRSYLSALENDLRPAPTEEFLNHLIQALALNEEDAESLRVARSLSRRTYTLPSDSPPATFEFVHELFSRLEKLTARHVRALNAVLQIGDHHPGRNRTKSVRPLDTDVHPRKEDAM